MRQRLALTGVLLDFVLISNYIKLNLCVISILDVVRGLALAARILSDLICAFYFKFHITLSNPSVTVCARATSPYPSGGFFCFCRRENWIKIKRQEQAPAVQNSRRFQRKINL